MINQGKTQKLDELVALVLKQMGLDRKFKECEVSELWPQDVYKRQLFYRPYLITGNEKRFFRI